MPQIVADIMTSDPVTIEQDQTITAAAKLMASRDIGDVVVLNNGKVAAEKDPDTQVAEICGDAGLVTVAADTPVDKAVTLMRKHSVRKLPVVRKGQAVGVISIARPGDRARFEFGARRHLSSGGKRLTSRRAVQPSAEAVPAPVDGLTAPSDRQDHRSGSGRLDRPEERQ